LLWVFLWVTLPRALGCAVGTVWGFLGRFAACLSACNPVRPTIGLFVLLPVCCYLSILSNIPLVFHLSVCLMICLSFCRLVAWYSGFCISVCSDVRPFTSLSFPFLPHNKQIKGGGPALSKNVQYLSRWGGGGRYPIPSAPRLKSRSF
jgi:hypothetical protein